MDIKIFSREVAKNGIITKKWYYSFVDSDSGKKRTLCCKNCTNEAAAKAFVRNIKFQESPYLIKNIACDMYKDGCEQMNRLNQFGKSIDTKTIQQKRFYIELILKQFGDRSIKSLKISEIESWLISDTHSPSWKNCYLQTFCSIYDETSWKCPDAIPRPKFISFMRTSRRPAVFTTMELASFFEKSLWKNQAERLQFLCMASCGLRIGEARALRVKQIVSARYPALIIDGFCKNDGTRTNFNKKGSEENPKIRIVPLPKDVYELLAEHIRRFCLKSEDFIFTRNGKPVRQEYLESVFKKQLKCANIVLGNRKLVPHSLRFTYVTRMRRFASVDMVQKLVGHTSQSMTNYYNEPNIEDLLVSIKGAQFAAQSLFE